MPQILFRWHCDATSCAAHRLQVVPGTLLFRRTTEISGPGIHSAKYSLVRSITVSGACDDEGMKDQEERGDSEAAGDEVAAARREAAIALAKLAEVSVKYADARIADDRRSALLDQLRPGHAKAGEFVADELSLVLREQPYTVRCLLARSRRVAAGLPTVWEAFRRGDLDADQVRVIDRVARRVGEPQTLGTIDDQSVDAAQTRCPKQLGAWLLRLVVRLEPLAFEKRHRRALAERRVTVVQGVDGMGYVTGEVSAADAAAIDGMLAAAARSLGAEDPRTEHQRRSDMFADLLLGRLRLIDRDDADVAEDGRAAGGFEGEDDGDHPDWLELEDVDPDTGELFGTRLQRIDTYGEPIGERIDPEATLRAPFAPTFVKRPRQLRIGVVVPVSSLLGLSDAPAELADRSGLIPGEVLRDQIAEALTSEGQDEVLFTRLLTDGGGRLMDTTELGRYASARLAQAVKIRAGTCRFPTCNVPADRCDVDHHEPWPTGPTSADNLDPLCRRHHRGKTFAWLASVRDDDVVDWTMPDAAHYRCADESLPIGVAA
jgi:Domain of unknown function (DUF222)